MSADAPEKSARKHKKTKARGDAEQETGVVEKPRNSKKKARTESSAADEAQQFPETSEAATTTEDAAPEKKEKKHKKRKHAEDEEEDARPAAEKPKKKKRGQDESATSAAQPEHTSAVEDASEAATKSGKKAKGKKKKKEEEGEEGASAEKAEAADGDVDHAAQSDSRSPKGKREKKKDKKKRKKGARDDEDGGADDAEAASSSSKPQKKRKRRTVSGFPDPTGDEALSEQAQKALHYAFTQFEEPGEWKFNKARQNWIIRNLWSEETIPETYVPLVSRYLQGVQGGAREALIKSCREALEPSQPTAEVATTKASETTPAESEPQDASTKRTVKFEVPETQSSSSTTNDTKRQRAKALLALLTSNTS